MRLLAIGDIQGCFKPLQDLLGKLRFNPAQDRLLLTGDLVNRGPESLEVLRYVRSLGDSAITVLGNHDLHLIAASASGKFGPRDTLEDLMRAPDRDELLSWLRRQPLAVLEPRTQTLMIHAGLPPQWTLQQTLALAQEASQVIAGPDGDDFLRRMYGNEPDLWSESLTGIARTRFIVNCLTRMRYCTAQGRLDLKHKNIPGSQPANLMPWFAVPGRKTAGTNIICGHWSTLGRIGWPEHKLHGLDTGCVWGGCLTALDVESGELHSVSCEEFRKPGAEQD